MNIFLLIHNFGYITSAILSLALGIFVLSRGVKRNTHILFFLTTFTFVVYLVAHVIAVNTTDPFISRNYSLLTSVILFTVCFNAHFGFAVFNLIKQHKIGIIALYTTATVLAFWIIKMPSHFALPSMPNQFFPNFLVSGQYYFVILMFFIIAVVYFFSVLIFRYSSLDAIDKKRMNYFLISFGFAYLLGSLFFLPVFGIPLNMIPTAFIGLYVIPLAYGFLKYDLLELHIVARNAIGYFTLLLTVGLATTGINILNNYLIWVFPNFPFWPIPFFSGILILGIGILIWKQIRQVDILKYEFINNISHKFRTPLTHIRWIAEELRDMNDESMRNKLVDQIQFASLRLFELTSTVIDVSHNENDVYLYRFVPVHIDNVLKDLVASHGDLIEHKQMRVIFDVPDNFPSVQADKTRITFALQIVFENALIYTPEVGSISIKIRQIGNEILIQIKDSGIGILEGDIERIFSKFYRSASARRTDTEGMGISLYMAKNIIEKHKGSIWVKSEGDLKGTEFTVSLPIK